MSDEITDEAVAETLSEQEEGPQALKDLLPLGGTKAKRKATAKAISEETKAQRNKRLREGRRKVEEKELDELHKEDQQKMAAKKKVGKKTKSGRRQAPNERLTDEQMNAWISKQLAKDPMLAKTTALKMVREEGYPMGFARFFKAFASATRKGKPKAKPKKKAAA